MPPKSTTKTAAPSKKPVLKKDSGLKKHVLTPQERLKRLFTTLCAQIDGGHFSNAVKTCDKVLEIEPKDVDARQTKLFLLLQTEQYEAALALIASDEDPSDHAYERAYSLYRMQRESAAKEVLTVIKEEQGEDDRGIVHLEAQLKYREASYQEAFDLYNQLLDTAESNSDEHSDILTNLQASQKHLDFIERGYLHAMDALPASIASSLESVPPPVQHTAPSSVPGSSSSSAEQKVLQQPKKPRARRVPAGVIPGVTPPPDPERWLKKSDRSNFGQGMKKRKGQGGGGGGGATQGSSTVENTPPSNTAAGASKSGGGKKKKK